MNRFKIIIVVICVLLVGCAGTGGATRQVPNQSQVPLAAALEAAPSPSALATPMPVSPTAAPTPAPTAAPAPTEINLMAVGDLMFQYREIASAYDRPMKSYDFDYSFKYVKDILGSADMALGNLETTLGGPRYSQPETLLFSAPDSVADALKVAGFDVLSTANNHANNKGSAGIMRTQQVLSSRGLAYTGTRLHASDRPYVIEDIKGIKVGITAYSWCTRLAGGAVELDYGRLGKDVKGLVNIFSNSTIDKDLVDMGKVAQQMRNDGAEIVVFYMHWGTEYQRNPDGNQKKIAQGLANAGVDIIFGCHPHWMQTVDVLKNGKTGGKTIVAYSLGNFISCQRKEYKDPHFNFKYSEDCMILNVKIEKQPGGKATVSQVEYLPTWTLLYAVNGKRFYTVVPLEKAIASPTAYGMNAKGDLKKAEKSLANTQKLLAGSVLKGYLSLMKLP